MPKIDARNPLRALCSVQEKAKVRNFVFMTCAMRLLLGFSRPTRTLYGSEAGEMEDNLDGDIGSEAWI
jgi:hypothetical protein